MKSGCQKISLCSTTERKKAVVSLDSMWIWFIFFSTADSVSICISHYWAPFTLLGLFVQFMVSHKNALCPENWLWRNPAGRMMLLQRREGELQGHYIRLLELLLSYRKLSLAHWSILYWCTQSKYPKGRYLSQTKGSFLCLRNCLVMFNKQIILKTCFWRCPCWVWPPQHCPDFSFCQYWSAGASCWGV